LRIYRRDRERTSSSKTTAKALSVTDANRERKGMTNIATHAERRRRLRVAAAPGGGCRVEFSVPLVRESADLAGASESRSSRRPRLHPHPQPSASALEPVEL
jgi:hypothetical protein